MSSFINKGRAKYHRKNKFMPKFTKEQLQIAINEACKFWLTAKTKRDKARASSMIDRLQKLKSTL